ncbi:MAG: RluA family pseudouridine synthase [Acidiferrobacteraceae bacterium]
MVLHKNEAPTVTHVTIDDRRSGQRLDNFLIATLKGVPRTHIYRIVRRGEVRINRARAKPDYKLKQGDIVRLPPVRMRPVRAETDDPGRLAWMEARILHEDAALLVLDKPSGLAVHGGSGIHTGLIEGLRALRQTQNPFLELVHRLDRETSGCLLVAKSRAALGALHAQLREGRVRKEYLALVPGPWDGGARQVDLALHRSGSAPGERLVRADEGGKPSSTRFTPERRFSDTTLVRVRLDTGRTHQARVHAHAIGYPIAGDPKYGDRLFNARLKRLGLRRLFLHAARVTFAHPVTAASFTVSAPLPDDLAQVLEALGS